MNITSKLYLNYILILSDLFFFSLFLVDNAISCCLQHYIQIDVWDYDTLNRDDFMGRIQIPLALLSENTTAYWYPLGRGSAKGNGCGEIFVELTLQASQVQNNFVHQYHKISIVTPHQKNK